MLDGGGFGPRRRPCCQVLQQPPGRASVRRVLVEPGERERLEARRLGAVALYTHLAGEMFRSEADRIGAALWGETAAVEEPA